MNRSSPRPQLVIYQSIVYFCGFLLFWEWLRPLESVSDTGDITLFVIFTAFCFFITLLKLQWWLATPLKIAGIIFIIDGLFITERLFSSSWFYVLYMHLQVNMERMLQQQWTEMTSLFRSLLFLLLIWVMIYLLYYWFVVAKRVFLFVLLTLIYITVLDTFTIYQGNEAIVRTFIVSMIALGLSSILKEVDHGSTSFLKQRSFFVWVIPLVAVVLFASAIGYASPKKEPQWPDPVPFLTSTAENAGVNDNIDGNGPVQKVGYGEDDSNLGGSFIQDDTPVFEAAVEQAHYWRIESKDRYTGKGWERSSDLSFEEQRSTDLQLNLFDDSVETMPLNAMVKFEPDSYIGKLVYPYGLSSVVGDESVQYSLDHQTGTIVAEAPERQVVLDRYQLSYQYPSFSLQRLQNSSEQDPQSIVEQYLQLPDSLPQRVYDLAKQETENMETRYGKVKAIENYFRYNGYRYQTQNVARPGREDDYVDQFLFETKVGYCDNFSTSMVVMLRSLDIPARWVKGFTSGEKLSEQPDDLLDQELEVYQVSNSNAHSWVEVYFPEIGWVPFEPTQGFISPVDFYQETSTTEGEDREQTDDASAEEEEQEETNEGATAEEETEDGVGSSFASAVSFQATWLWTIIIAIVGVIGVILYITRYRWGAMITLRKFRAKQDNKSFQDAYHFLLKMLQHKGITRSVGQTLRDYAMRVDDQLDSKDMTKLTLQYERLLYSNRENSFTHSGMTELLENLVKRTLS